MYGFFLALRRALSNALRIVRTVERLIFWPLLEGVARAARLLVRCIVECRRRCRIARSSNLCSLLDLGFDWKGLSALFAILEAMVEMVRLIVRLDNPVWLAMEPPVIPAIWRPKMNDLWVSVSSLRDSLDKKCILVTEDVVEGGKVGMNCVEG